MKIGIDMDNTICSTNKKVAEYERIFIKDNDINIYTLWHNNYYANLFLTKYLTELYPTLILMAAVGWAQLNSQSHRIMLATVYIFATLFFIVVSHTSAIRLTRMEGQRLPVVAMEEMKIKNHDKILFLYYPPAHFAKYMNLNNYICYSIDKYNFPYVMDMGTTYSAFKNGYQDYRVFF